MAIDPTAKAMLLHEARALLARLALVKPFALQEPMLPAAALLPRAQVAIDKLLVLGRRNLRRRVHAYLQWLEDSDSDDVTAAEAQRRFTILRLRFNIVLVHFDLFSDVITQRSESETGVWLSGLDVASADALNLPGFYNPPPIICYLDRDVGAAIRRARTRLPGGSSNPVAIVRVPRERMVGSGIASSLVHEVGHQAAAQLDLVNSLRPILQGMQRGAGAQSVIWKLWERWISEIVADFWSVARVGISSTMGLIGVVSLPRAFVFRLNVDDPHPTPWIRVLLSAAIGDALYPHPQWRRLSAVWESFYPLGRLAGPVRDLLVAVQAGIPALVSLMINHRPKALRGHSLREVLDTERRQPATLSAAFEEWMGNPAQMYRAPPSLAFAVLGQARADNRLNATDESVVISKLLTHWALRATLNTSEICADAPSTGRIAA